MHRFHDAARDLHVFDLLPALDGTLPVHERQGILELCIRQVLDEGLVGSCREVVIVHLDGDGALVPATLADDPGQVVHRMAFRGLNIMVRIADDVVVGEIGCALGAVGILAAAIPDRLAVGGHQHALMHIERPAIIARQPMHVGWIGDDQQIYPGSFHRFARLRETLGIFRSAEVEIGCAHGVPPVGSCVSMARPAPASTARRRARVAMAVSCTPVPVRSQRVMASRLSRPGICAGDHLTELSKGSIRRNQARLDGVMQFAEASRLCNAVGDIDHLGKDGGLDFILVL